MCFTADTTTQTNVLVMTLEYTISLYNKNMKRLTRLKCNSRNFRSLASLFSDAAVSVGSSSVAVTDSWKYR